ncbi:CPBP family intramembrane glutamic endopeptidase [Mangrovicoccus algicola]|uniref:CPBP family intramembrane metalloprotease n=1 Tax=Mangrovicoccus algicola TaxID=2771008 RepID=A0A8J7CKQ5_9RHOB|nr:type II CAAX endopeptidase family protein [Mangrovicoccus algicola]MBE3639136.1 CPBP family intramembrane metalloprotease [Mangrovicoccus algicola]
MPPRFERFIAPARPRSGLWRTLLAILAILVLTFALQAAGLWAAVGLLGPGAPAVLEDLAGGATPLSVLVLLASFLPLVLSVLLVTRLLLRRPPATLWGEGWLPDFLRAALVMALVMTAFLWVAPGDGDAAASLNVDPVLWASLLLPALILIAGQTLAEELMFRALLMQQLAARLPRWPLIWFWLPALLFGAAHYAPGLGVMSPLAMGYALAFGLAAADLTRRSGNLGSAWGLHLANNAFAILVFSSESQLSGLALWHVPYPVEALQAQPWLALVDLVPLALAWAILARPTAR